MNCEKCKYWIVVGESIGNLEGLDLNTDLGSCTCSDAIDGIIRTEQEGENLMIHVIFGVSTGLYTKPDFGCKYFQEK